MSTSVRCLRPWLSPRFQCLQRVQARRSFTAQIICRASASLKDVTHDYEKRVKQLEARAPASEWYPRLPASIAEKRVDLASFAEKWDHLEPGTTAEGERLVLAGTFTGMLKEIMYKNTELVAGKIKSIRTAGSKLVFMDINAGGHTVQAVVQLSHLQKGQPESTVEEFKGLARLARRGDSYTVTGSPHRTARGQVSILATELPAALSPSLHQIPSVLDDAETRARHPHVDMLVNPDVIQTLKTRHHVETGLDRFFQARGFLKANTPILGADAGGANARPFATIATELPDETLHLRVAPELWLKRLIIGGLERVYEIGPAFRNEGVDATHNPEFSICEFYQTYTTLNDLMQMTEDLLAEIFRPGADRPLSPDAQVALHESFSGQFARLEFLPALEAALGETLPDLSDTASATAVIRRLFTDRQLSMPSPPTLPRLLDALSAHYLEPQSLDRPTFLIHPPACLSPLSKHFTCPTTGHQVAARAELFYGGRELANMYEEENSPFAQRAKFAAQRGFRKGGDGAKSADDEAMDSDEGFLRALEWSLPPTGGWGCGIDRLVMLLSGRTRIADVQPFGTLRNVVALGTAGRE